METVIVLVMLVLAGGLLCGFVLPIVALVQLRNARRELRQRLARLEAILPAAIDGQPPAARGQEAPGQLLPTTSAFTEAEFRARLEGLEAAILKLQSGASPGLPAVEEKPADRKAPVQSFVPETPAAETPRSYADASPPAPALAQPPGPPTGIPPTGLDSERLEAVIGRRLVGWAAVVLILFSLAFFLKYAFENRWVGELGRVAIGMMAGIALSAAGLHYHRRGWRVFSQITTAGGIMLLYLSTYSAFGFYHLIDQSVAFPFLALLVAEAAALAWFYNAPAIAMMALAGGFLAPILLRTDRDQYRALFGYLIALDIGALAVLKRWTGLASLAWLGTQFLFWSWYEENYHPQKRLAVMVFQTAVFALFFGAHLLRQRIKGRRASVEDLALLLVNPFVFYATSYHLLDTDYHEWMGALAIVLAAIHAGAGRLMLGWVRDSRSQLLVIATALMFVVLAVPIQLRSNWITLAWAIEGLLMVWVGFEVRSNGLRAMGLVVLAMSIFRLIAWDTRLEGRRLFTPALNRYFLSSVAVSLIVFGVAMLFRKFREQWSKPYYFLALTMVGAGLLWFVLTVETYTYFEARAFASKNQETARDLSRLGGMSVSVLWSVYAAVLAAIGFIRRIAEVRWAALALFTLTMLKVVFVDMAALEQFYRIIAFFVLGFILLAVAWRYQKAFQVKEPSK